MLTPHELKNQLGKPPTKNEKSYLLSQPHQAVSAGGEHKHAQLKHFSLVSVQVIGGREEKSQGMSVTSMRPSQVSRANPIIWNPQPIIIRCKAPKITAEHACIH
jgi:hypothetical protein